MDTVSELLFRAGIVRTFCQVEGVESVTFFVDEKPLTNSSFAPLGAQTASDYVDIIGNGLSSQKKTSLTLYKEVLLQEKKLQEQGVVVSIV